ncbi:uncharacterized protein LOC126889902 [Diabrotica virgifera virgifera]|uniref:Uncharacterized protein LOC114342289 n=1 Tax=Diabrotica virgifera virgifera TaxID=50390 RepID=A0A6P7GGK0_DIAVI|nr:uncharacterized protein LOC126889902 [Diabrotica virgifera virgifera]
MWIYEKLLGLLLFMATTNSNPLHSYAPAHEDYKPTDYSFSYGVKDYHTGDIKHQWEKKDGNKITGHYSLVEPDGSIRSVEYSADEHSGFNAVVKHTGSFKHPITHVHSKIEPSSHHELILHQGIEAQKLHQAPEYNVQYKYIYPEQEEAKYETEASSHQLQEELLQQNYAYNHQEESAEESQHTPVKTKHRYKSHNPNAIKSQLTIKEDYGNLVPELPIDLSVIKGSHVEPVDVSVLNPVEINLKDLEESKQFHSHKYSAKDVSVQPSHELTEAEIRKYLQDYYLQNNDVPSDPYVETGFKPIKTKSKDTITQPNIPGTFTSNKKPKTTPGLSTYNTKGIQRTKHMRRKPKMAPNYYQTTAVQAPSFHYYFPPEEAAPGKESKDVTRLYRSLPNRGYVRYATYAQHQQ